MSGDVLEEASSGPDFVDKAGNIRPQVAGIGSPGAATGCTEWLTRVAANDAIHDSTPRSAVEGSQISENRRFIQGTVFHARSQYCDGICLDLDKADRASISARQMDAEIEPPGSRAKAEDIESGISHMQASRTGVQGSH